MTKFFWQLVIGLGVCLVGGLCTYFALTGFSDTVETRRSESPETTQQELDRAKRIQNDLDILP